MSTDNPVTVSMHRDEYDPKDNQPLKQQVIISDENDHLLIVDHHSDGAATLRLVAHSECKAIYLNASIYQTFVVAGYERMLQLEQWEEKQEQTQKQREAADNAEQLPDLPHHAIELVFETPKGHGIFFTNDFE